MTKKLGLVTVLYNSPDVLDDFFRSIASQEYTNFHLYVVDNSSIPEPLAKSRQLACEYKIPCTFIDNQGNNLGVAAGNNQGISAALNDNVDVIGLINNDLIFDHPTVFSSLIDTLSSGQNIVSPIIYAFPSDEIWYDNGYFDLMKGTTPHSGRSEKKIPYAPTCFLLVNKKVITDTGLMDEKYFAYYDDSDFVFRAHKAGYSVFVNTQASIQHKVSTSTGGTESPFSLYYGTRNRLYFIKKNTNGTTKCIAYLYTMMTRSMYLLKPRLENKKSIVKGIVDFLRM
ncbi:glycosyltransferase family 2 protein [Vibrio vulnificus]|uniref:glycosyltransferase family 2 protein n=1 Tax=Vibrio vulnificus TaxID=672 RepID=UPI000C7D75AB|nr:glycosyltransferase family 2 protein [Vibrio vulnificus]AUL94347.1 Glycosyltransferase [Vibrio vulnificus]EGQ8079999.1 glycosyltransferase family 2 protein [Vibrio vulnificus]ELX4196443.1 glycosyltransferase family 2 protein [Vibrio vulnificus]PNG70176.1 glycosyl transferase [Vibrio vulnificus]